jgi:hypothetical protein
MCLAETPLGRSRQLPVGAENRVTPCDVPVLMGESAETIAPKNAKVTAGF